MSLTFARAYPNPKKKTLSTVAIAVSLSIQAGTVPDLVSPAPSAEGGNRLLLAATPSGEWRTRVVDELSEPSRKVRLELCRLIRGDLAGRLGGIDLGGRVGDERVYESLTALARGRVRDLRQRLTRPHRRFEVGGGRAEVRGGGRERIAGH